MYRFLPVMDISEVPIQGLSPQAPQDLGQPRQMLRYKRVRAQPNPAQGINHYLQAQPKNFRHVHISC